MERKVNGVFNKKSFMNTPLISIIIPIYNAEKYLHQCLDSVVAQTYTNWECLLIDDGSKDASGAICDDYAAKDPRFRVFHKENGGVSSARNLGLDNIKGKWVTFSDSDDEFMPCALSIYNNSISNDYVDVLKAGYVKLNRDNKIELEVTTTAAELIDKKEIYFKYQESKYYGFLWNTAIKSSIIKSLRFDNKISWCEDMLFVLEAIKMAKEVIFISDVVYKYYYSDPVKGENNLSNKVISPKMVLDMADKERKLIKSLIGEDDQSVYEINNVYQYKVNYAILNSVLLKDFATAIKIFKNYSLGKCSSISYVVKELAQRNRMFCSVRNSLKLIRDKIENSL